MFHGTPTKFVMETLRKKSEKGETKKLEGLFQSGDFQASIVAAQDYTDRFPADPTGWKVLGDAHAALSSWDKALGAFQVAEKYAQDKLQVQFAIASVLEKQGRIDEAVNALNDILTKHPKHLAGLLKSGELAVRQQRYSDAIAIFERALSQKKRSAPIENNLGVVYEYSGNLTEATKHYRLSLKLDANFADAHNNLGSLLQAQGKLQLAHEHLSKAIRINPAHLQARNNFARLLHDQGALTQAANNFRHALSIAPRSVEILNNFASVLKDMHDFASAEAVFKQAIAINPAYAKSHNNLGNLHSSQGEIAAAISDYEAAVNADPKYIEPRVQLIATRQHACEWSHFREDQAWLVDAANTFADKVQPFVLLNSPTIAEPELLVHARKYADRNIRISPLTAPKRLRDGPIRIGYLSSDFHDHATTRLMAGMLEQHDRQRFSIQGFSYGVDDNSKMRKRVVAAFDQFSDITNTAHQDSALLIQKSNIDILVELKGYTFGSRPQIARYRPAPVQVNYLGYPGTLGSDMVDYLIADGTVIPPSARCNYAENIVFMPHSYQVNDSKRHIAVVEDNRTDHGLPVVGFVFCSFNNTNKITPEVFAVWMRILKRVPGSVLWMLAANSLVEKNLKVAASNSTVAPERLVFAPRMSLPEHLARHQHAGLFMDTMPYNAHTTASDALWAGLPVLTCAGSTFAGRVSGSLIKAVGMPDFVVQDLAAYEAFAVDYGTNLIKQKEAKSRLALNRKTMPLFDTQLFTRHIEFAYTEMHERSIRGLQPADINVNSLIERTMSPTLKP
jgi:protein O-GlcNAc transferase